jgi:DNA polymerase-3 subunit delta'
LNFSDILGQDRNIALLRRSLETGKVGHSYLFEGIEGCGKRSTALAFIQALFCNNGEGCGGCPCCRKLAGMQHPDLHLVEPDGAFIKIDQVRELQRELSFRPFEAPRKACVIDTADRLNQAAGNALLKTLEEPPGNALIILVTANVGRMLPTILSRCQRLHFRALPQETLERHLLAHGSDQETARLSSTMADGSLGKALAISAETSLTGRRELLERIFASSLHDIGLLLDMAEELAGDKERVPDILDILTAFLRDILLVQGGSVGIVNHDLLHLVEREASRHNMGVVMERIGQVDQARHSIQRNVNARLTLEVLFMRLSEG